MDEQTEMLEETMTDLQAIRADLYARIEELTAVKDNATDLESMMKYIDERKKTLRELIEKTLNV